jgi:type IV secretion system protein VirD4
MMRVEIKKSRIAAFSAVYVLFCAAFIWAVSVLIVDTRALNNPMVIFTADLAEWQRLVIGVPCFLLFLVVLAAFIKGSLVDDDYGDAREATKAEARKELKCLEAEGLIWGQKWGEFIRTNNTLSTLLLAPPGTGKTAAVAVPTLFSCTWSMIVNDVKGELWNLTSKQRGTFGNVGLFAPSMGLKESLRFNPIGTRCCPQEYKQAFKHMDEMAEAIYPTADTQGAEGYFNREAKQYFVFWGMMLWFLHHYENDAEPSLPVMFDWASESTKETIAMLLDRMNEDHGDDFPREVYKLGFAISEKDDKDFGNCQTTFLGGIRPFWQPALRDQFVTSDFDYKTFRQKTPFTLYVTIPPRDMDTLAPVVRMLSIYLVNAFISEPIPSIKQRVLFLMDELARLGKMPTIVNAPEVARGYGVSFMFIAQSEMQLQALYGGNGVDAVARFNDVCAYTMIYTQNWQATAEKLSRNIGKRTVGKKSRSSRDGELRGSTSESKEGRPLFTDQDIMNLSQNKAIFVQQGFKERPILLDKAWWFKDKTMKTLAGAYNDMVLGEEYADDAELEREYVPTVDETDDIKADETASEAPESDADQAFDDGNIVNLSDKVTSNDV